MSPTRESASRFKVPNYSNDSLSCSKIVHSSFQTFLRSAINLFASSAQKFLTNRSGNSVTSNFWSNNFPQQHQIEDYYSWAGRRGLMDSMLGSGDRVHGFKPRSWQSGFWGLFFFFLLTSLSLTCMGIILDHEVTGSRRAEKIKP